jgi:hypothetical protein
MNAESIKTKIAALLNKAEKTDNAFEAETFMNKVNELLEKYQIEMTEIRNMRPAGDTDPMGHQQGETNIYASMLWARTLAGTVARYYGCKFIYWKRGNHYKYEVVGRESARVTFELMLPFIISQVKQQAKTLRHLTASVAQREVGQALLVRIARMIPVAEQRRSELTKNALIPVNDLEGYMAIHNPNVKTGKVTTLRFGRSAEEAASRISLHHQATAANVKRIR